MPTWPRPRLISRILGGQRTMESPTTAAKPMAAHTPRTDSSSEPGPGTLLKQAGLDGDESEEALTPTIKPKKSRSSNRRSIMERESVLYEGKNIVPQYM